MIDANRVEIGGTLVELEALRYTPAGIPVVRFRMNHLSEQVEASTPRKVACEIGGIAFDREARLIAAATLGTRLNVTGFLDRRSRHGNQLSLHATHIEFMN